MEAVSALLNQFSPVPRARSSIAVKDATRRRAHSASTDLCRLRKYQPCAVTTTAAHVRTRNRKIIEHNLYYNLNSRDSNVIYINTG